MPEVVVLMRTAGGFDVIEHGESSLGRTLRLHRLRIALLIALVEGILVLAGALPWWAVVIAGIVALATYVYVGRASSSGEIRNLTWIVAVSQLIVVLVPVAVAIVGALAVLVVVGLAVAALVTLLGDRR